jgi:hypothetical protein
MTQELQQLASGSSPAAQRAQYALQLATAHQAGQVSTDEYKALLEDLVRTDALEAEADSLESKQMLVFGVTQLIKMV